MLHILKGGGYWRQRVDERLGDTPPLRYIQEHLVVRDRDGRPQEDPLAVHCFCVCGGSALLGDLLGVSRSVYSCHDYLHKKQSKSAFASIRSSLLFYCLLPVLHYSYP